MANFRNAAVVYFVLFRKTDVPGGFSWRAALQGRCNCRKACL